MTKVYKINEYNIENVFNDYFENRNIIDTIFFSSQK